MRTVYLVRHGQPDTGFPGQKVCLGRKDVPLTHEGEKQAERLARWFRGKELSGMYTSPLARCRQTAEILAAKSGHVSLPLQTVEDFAEVDTGLWDGLPFPKIREQFPKEFEERGTHLGSYVLPGGESFAEAGARFASAFWTLYENTEGDLMITAHAGAENTPANTLESLRALAVCGADALEMDVRAGEDGPVLSHNPL